MSTKAIMGCPRVGSFFSKAVGYEPAALLKMNILQIFVMNSDHRYKRTTQ